MGLSPGTLRFSDWAPALRGADHSEIFLEDSSSSSVQFEDSRVTEVTGGVECGTGWRALRRSGPEVETLHASINAIDPSLTLSAADRLLGGSPRRAAPRPAPLDLHLLPPRIAPSEVPFEAKVELLRRADRAVRSSCPHISQVQLTYAERVRRFAILNSRGEFRYGERTSVAFVVGVTAAKGSTLQTSSTVIAGPKGFELFEDADPVRASLRTALVAVEKLDAPAARAGEMPVVLASSAGGTLIHEAIGHSLEADHVQEGTSPHYTAKTGRAVAGEHLTIIDDPTLPFACGSFPFDDEGLPARPTALVERGILKNYLYDESTAMREGRSSNGHGRRESFRHRPIPRMSNLYIAPGSDDPARIVRELDRGLLVLRMGGGEVNTATGEFMFSVDEGFLVEGGKVRHRVRDASILGMGPEVLASIDRLGWDIGWDTGVCDKQGQGVPVSDGQPTLRIPKLLVGGR